MRITYFFIRLISIILIILVSASLSFSQQSLRKTFATGSISQDSLALVALFNSTNGENWKRNTNWMSGKSLNEWFGVTVNEGRITEIELYNNNLDGPIPSEIGNLTRLSRLILDRNRLSGIIPPEFGNLISLTKMSLDNNHLSGSIPSEFGNLVNLRSIRLENNKLSGSLPNEFFHLVNLEVFNINDNNLSGSIPDEIGRLNQLYQINISNNSFSGELPASIGNIQNLSFFVIENNYFSGSVPVEFQSLKNLRYLRLSNNNIDGLPDLSMLTNLHDLFVENNKLTFEDLEPNMSVYDFKYSNQDSIGTFLDTTLTYGDSYHISFPSGGTANTYQWYKWGVEIPGADSDAYSIDSFSPSDAGYYTLKITNSTVPELTLHSRAVIVRSDTFIQYSDLKHDSLALVALYHSTNGDNWYDNTNWLSEKPVSEWFGISVKDGRVKKLSLSSNNLGGWLIPALGNLTELAHLNLSRNNINGPLPKEIGNCTKMEDLKIQACRISGSIPPEIGNLTELTSLRLDYNRLTGPIPAEIGNLTKLQELFLFRNSIEGPISEEIGNLENLLYLELQKNRITGPIPSGTGNLSKLKRINLSDNLLTGHIPQNLGNCTHLIDLNLENNQLSGSIPNSFKNLQNLRSLNIDDNLIEDLPDLSSLSRLRLYCNNNKLTFEDLEPNTSVIRWSYFIQDSIGSFIDTTLSYGEYYEISIPVGGSANAYQWFKSGQPFEDINSDTYIIPAFTIADTGSYCLQVTNPLVHRLTLYSRTVKISTDSIPPNIELQQDSLTLIKLYNATGGDNWKNNTNWLSKEPLNNWYGVRTYNRRVREVSLGDNGLNGNIPPELGDLWGLHKLYLYNNHFEGEIPFELGRLSELEVLSLYGNDLAGSIPVEIGKLYSLERFYLYNTGISGFIPEEIGDLRNLTSLRLNNNRLTGALPESICNLHSMEYMDLSNNKMTGKIPDDFANFQNLKSLDLSNNNFTDLPDLSQLTNLILVNVERNILDFADLESIINTVPGIFIYQPQKNYGREKILRISRGESINLNSEIGGSQNEYRWYKDGKLIPGFTSSGFFLNPERPSQFGRYYVSVSNPLVPELQIQTRGIRIYEKKDQETLYYGEQGETVPAVITDNNSISTFEYDSCSSISLKFFNGNVSGRPVSVTRFNDLSESPNIPETDTTLYYFKFTVPSVKYQVEVSLVYTDEMLAAKSIRERDLAINSYDFSENKWRTEPGILDTLSNTITIITDHLSFLNLGKAQSHDSRYYDRDIVYPEVFRLMQNYPNPFNPSTTIEFSLKYDSFVELSVFNITGSEIRKLISENFPAGRYKILWDGKDRSGIRVSTGVYFYRMRSGGKTITRKMILIK